MTPKNEHNYLNNFHMEIPQIDIEECPEKQYPKSKCNWSSGTASCTTDHTSTKGSASSTSPQLISFNNSNPPRPATTISDQQSNYHGRDCNPKPPKNEVDYIENTASFPPYLISQGDYSSYETHKGLPKLEQGFKGFGAISRSPLHAQDHVIAERKRREKLTQKFIALSAVLPSLKKVGFIETNHF